MSNRVQNIRGMRDHLPSAMILRQYIIDTLTSVFERYGFEPLQTPVVEYAETLDGKIGDDEKLIYRFEDHGGRKVALRYDQTVPLARVVCSIRVNCCSPGGATRSGRVTAANVPVAVATVSCGRRISTSSVRRRRSPMQKSLPC